MAKQTLKTVEDSIQNGILAVGLGLMEIQDKQLYLADHTTFEDYCKERWGFSKSAVYQHIANTKTSQNVSAIVDTKTVKNAHLREIAKAPEKKQAQIAATVIEQCEQEGVEPTAKHYRAAVKPYVKPPEPKPKPTAITETVEYEDDSLIKCPFCTDGKIKKSEADGGFSEFWEVTQDAPAGSRLRKDRATAEKRYRPALRDVASKGIDDPRGWLKARFMIYVNSPDGQGEFAVMTSTWLSKKRYDDDPATWTGNGHVSKGEQRSRQNAKVLTEWLEKDE